MGKSRSVPYVPVTPPSVFDVVVREPRTLFDEVFESGLYDGRDTSQFVHLLRPAGIKCDAAGCPYNDNAYYQDHIATMGGRCLNCMDDERRCREESY